jgi:hypothetical protein
VGTFPILALLQKGEREEEDFGGLLEGDGIWVKTTAKILGWHPFSVRYHLKQADENVWREARSIVRRWRYVREP